MSRFRSADSQALHCVLKASAIGASKPAAGATRIHSLGTRRTYRVSVRIFFRWVLALRVGTDMQSIAPELGREWLLERSTVVEQKCLDNDRQALNVVLGFDLPRVTSSYKGERQLAKQARAYTAAQVELIIAHQSPRNGFSTRLAEAAGLRAHELFTLRPASECPKTLDRDWSGNRFLGLSGALFTVTGKGGLTREVLLPAALAEQLEAWRRPKPVTVVDRGISYLNFYEVAGGNAWSKSFSDASQRALGYSHGAHGLRHSYVQRRKDQLQQAGLSEEQALLVDSQEVGHFRPDITQVYLR